MYKLDLHTHSYASPDGGLTKEDYRQILRSGLLDCVAVTDHNRIDAAVQIKQELGEQIIVGEEVMTASGEIIGLYLEKPVPPGLAAMETVRRIKDQGGLVYIPHPFETIRKGMPANALEELIGFVDIMELYNGRAMVQNQSAQAVLWAKLNHVVGAASSDAHGLKGVGKTYTAVTQRPTQDTLLQLIATGTPIVGRPGLRAVLYPKYHRLRKKIRSED